MSPSEFRRVEIAADVLHGSVTRVPAELFGITVTIASSSGDVLETAGFEEAIDLLCGPGRNRVIDSISGRRAQIVAAEDTTTGALLCRVCLLDRDDRMALRFNLLEVRDLRRMVQTTGQRACGCGRMLT